MTTETRLPTFTTDALACVELAKAIATDEGSRLVAGVHIVRAAIHLQPAEATNLIGIDSATGAFEGTQLPVEPDPDLRMRASKGLAELLRELAQANNPVGVADLLRAILKSPCIRVTQFLASVDARPGQDPLEQPYRAAQDHLSDLKQLWRLRAMARDQRASSASSGLWTCAMAMQSGIERRSENPARLIPVSSETTLVREVLEGLVVHEFYGLGGRRDQGVELRFLTQLLHPDDSWLRDIGPVTEAIAGLERRYLVERVERSGQVRPTDTVRIHEVVIADVLEVFANDPFTREEVDSFSSRLGHLRA